MLESMIVKQRLDYLFFLFLVASINIFLVNVLTLSPIYFAFVISFFLFFCLFSFRPNIRLTEIQKDEGFLVLSLFIVCISILVTTVLNQGNVRTCISVIFPYIYFIFSFSIIKVPKKHIIKSLYVLKNITLILFFIEVVYRFSHSVPQHSYFYIYDYKHNSIMFPDTNATAVCIEFFLCFLLYLRERKIIHVNYFEILFTICLLILSFSRAALFGFFCLFGYLFFIKAKSFFVKIFMIISIFIAFFYVLLYFFSDGSFLIRLDIFVKTMEYIKRIDFLHLFFGNGLDSSVRFLSRYGHNFVTLFIIELGINAFILLLFFFACLIAKTKYSLFMIIPYVTTGLSYMPFVIPFFFLYLGLIYNIELHRNDLFNSTKIRTKKYGKIYCICFTYRR